MYTHTNELKGREMKHFVAVGLTAGLLASSVAWAGLVVFPVDCIDHDSATNLKRLCARQGVEFLPLRSASVASFAAGISPPSEPASNDRSGPSTCMKHG